MSRRSLVPLGLLPLTTDPTGQYVGDSYWNSTQGVIRTYNGTQWVVSSGVQGTTGIQGTVGTTGTQGTEGAQGTAGSQGTTGAGTQGTEGAQGTQGTIGTGTQGTQGIAGTSPSGSATIADIFMLGGM